MVSYSEKIQDVDVPPPSWDEESDDDYVLGAIKRQIMRRILGAVTVDDVEKACEYAEHGELLGVI